MLGGRKMGCKLLEDKVANYLYMLFSEHFVERHFRNRFTRGNILSDIKELSPRGLELSR